jgi:hypothetical protein
VPLSFFKRFEFACGYIMTSSALTPSSVADWYKRFGGFSARIFVIFFEFEDSTLIRKKIEVCVFYIVFV